MTTEPKSDRKPRARISVSEHLVQLRDRKQAEVHRLTARARDLCTSLQKANEELAAATKELDRLKAAVAAEPESEAAQ